MGDKVPVKLLREKAVVDTEVELKPLIEICPTVVFDRHPEYLVHCGLLFQPLSVSLLEEYFQSALLAPTELLYMCSGAQDAAGDIEQVVVLTRVFKDTINVGYEEEEFSIIDKVNGVKPKSLRHLASILKETKKPKHKPSKQHKTKSSKQDRDRSPTRKRRGKEELPEELAYLKDVDEATRKLLLAEYEVYYV